MTDYRMQTSWRTHPKRVKLQRRLGYVGIVTLGNLWSWCADQRGRRSTGSLSGMDVEDIAIAAELPGDIDPQEWVDCLVELRLLDIKRGAYHIHDWRENQPWLSGFRDRSRRSSAAARKKYAKEAGNQNRVRKSSNEFAQTPAENKDKEACQNGLSACPITTTTTTSVSNSNTTTPQASPKSARHLVEVIQNFGWGLEAGNRQKQQWAEIRNRHGPPSDALISRAREITETAGVSDKTRYFVGVVRRLLMDGWEDPPTPPPLEKSPETLEYERVRALCLASDRPPPVWEDYQSALAGLSDDKILETIDQWMKSA